MRSVRTSSSYSHILISWSSLEQIARSIGGGERIKCHRAKGSADCEPCCLSVLDVLDHRAIFPPTEDLGCIMQRQTFLKIPKMVFPLPKGQLRGRIFTYSPSCSMEVYKTFRLILKSYFHKGPVSASVFPLADLSTASVSSLPQQKSAGGKKLPQAPTRSRLMSSSS